MSNHTSAGHPMTGFDYEFARLELDDLDDLAALEKICFPHPWKKEHFCLGLAKGAFYVFGLKNAGRTAAYLAFSRKPTPWKFLNWPCTRTTGALALQNVSLVWS